VLSGCGGVTGRAGRLSSGPRCAANVDASE